MIKNVPQLKTENFDQHLISLVLSLYHSHWNLLSSLSYVHYITLH